MDADGRRTAAATAPPAIDPASNAGVLASALGIASSTFADWPHAADVEQVRARAMNVALWAPTWETMFERILRTDPSGRLLSDSDIDCGAFVFHRAGSRPRTRARY